MYLFKKQTISILFLLCAISSCTEDKKTPDIKDKYFDIRGFFDKEVSRLSARNLSIWKTVTHNAISEEKQVKISNWKNELEVFSASDINKPSWRDSYSIKSTDKGLIYTATDNDLKIRVIRINKLGNQVVSIDIETKVSNEIYSSNESLNYYPDSLYKIQKAQKVIGMGRNTYQINGKIKP